MRRRIFALLCASRRISRPAQLDMFYSLFSKHCKRGKRASWAWHRTTQRQPKIVWQSQRCQCKFINELAALLRRSRRGNLRLGLCSGSYQIFGVLSSADNTTPTTTATISLPTLPPQTPHHPAVAAGLPNGTSPALNNTPRLSAPGGGGGGAGVGGEGGR